MYIWVLVRVRVCVYVSLSLVIPLKSPDTSREPSGCIAACIYEYVYMNKYICI